MANYSKPFTGCFDPEVIKIIVSLVAACQGNFQKFQKFQNTDFYVTKSVKNPTLPACRTKHFISIQT